MRYAKGIMWLDDCRIPFVDEKDPSAERYKYSSKGSETWGGTFGIFDGVDKNEQQGRFTPNLLVCDDMLNDGSITKVQDNLKDSKKQYGGGNFGGGSVKNNFYFGDKGTNSRYYDLDKWFDKVIDEIR